VDDEIGVAVIDRFTYTALDFISAHRNGTLGHFADSWDVEFLHSRPVLDTSRLGLSPEDVLLSDFFTNQQTAIVDRQVVMVDGESGGIRDTKPHQLARPSWAAHNARLVIDKDNHLAAAALPVWSSIKL
jgi:glycosylphosphatidylinositol transamidase (GPIT) subunit GPI8